MAAAMEALDMPCSPSFVNAEMLISENALKAVRKILFLGKNKTWRKEHSLKNKDMAEKKKKENETVPACVLAGGELWILHFWRVQADQEAGIKISESKIQSNHLVRKQFLRVDNLQPRVIFEISCAFGYLTTSFESGRSTTTE